MTEVTSGLKTDDKLVADPNEKINSGTKVQFIQDDPHN